MPRLEKIVELNAPIEGCYKALLQFDRYPEFLPMVQNVQPRGGNHAWHWQIKTLDGTPLQWDLEILGGRHQHHSISWHTVRDADVAHSGAITLQSVSDHWTQLHFVAEYRSYTLNPVTQQIEHILEQSFHALRNFIERGKVTASPTVRNAAETLDKM